MQEINLISNEDNYDSLIYKGEPYYYYDQGLSRKVYVNNDKTKVIKINIESDYHNKKEIDIYLSSVENNLMAKTEYDEENDYIIQEFISPINRKLTMKEIIFYNSCRGEVGFNKENKLVCFDLDEFKKY